MGSGQVEWREAAVGLGVQFSSVLQEETCHGDVTPAAGAVKGCPPVHGSRVDPGPGSQ